MLPIRLAVVLLGLVRAAEAAAQPAACDAVALGPFAETARSNIIRAVDGVAAIEAWRTVLDRGGSVGWSATEYDVDARSVFVFAFDREALRVYRAGAFGPNTDDAMHGCIDPAVRPEASIPWHDVREIEAGNWVLWFRLRQPVEISSDRGKRKRVKELKVNLHSGLTGDLTYYYDLEYEGRVPFWNVDVYRVENLRGIAVGPTDYQRRLQFVIASVVDPGGRIVLKRKGRGAGW
jgi:hypothetical protein